MALILQLALTLQPEALQVKFDPFIKVGLGKPLQLEALQSQALTLLLAPTLQLVLTLQLALTLQA